MKVIDRDSLNRLSADAAERPRRRANWNLHPALDDPIQRFFNAMEPRTYVRPHRHDGAGRWECFFAIRGAAMVVTFSDSGVLLDRAEIAPDGDKDFAAWAPQEGDASCPAFEQWFREGALGTGPDGARE